MEKKTTLNNVLNCCSIFHSSTIKICIKTLMISLQLPIFWGIIRPIYLKAFQNRLAKINSINNYMVIWLMPKVKRLYSVLLTKRTA